MQTGLKPVWAGRTMRLDPFAMPQAFGGDDDVSYTIDQRGAVIHRKLEMSGVTAAIVIPARMFRGVAARAMEDGEGNVTVTLELLHQDADLCVPLLVAENLDDVAADWRAWAEAYCLPMLLIEADGVARSLEESLGMAIKVAQAKERRLGNPTRQRRSRFQMRRKQGSMGMRLVIDGREIVARR